MANSLRAKLSKLRHDGHITSEEYQELIKKLDGHDRELRAKAIDEFAEALYNKSTFLMHLEDDYYGMLHYEDVYEVAEQLKGGVK